MIDPRLRTLQLVARHGTVTAAAHALHYTPSAVSQQLRSLAADLGMPLYQQQGRGIRLTAAGRTLLRHVETLHTQAELARAELAAQAAGDDELAGTVGLCGFSTAAMSLLPPAAAALRDRFPAVRVLVVEAEPARCLDLLLAGDADLALLVVSEHTPATSDGRFDQQPLLDDPLDLVVPADHLLAQRPEVALGDAADEPWIVGTPGSTYYQLVMTACRAAGFTPRVAHHADEWDTGTALVAHGFGVILVPRLAQLHRGHEVHRIPLAGSPAPSRRIIAATRKGAREQPTVAHALRTITATARTLLPVPR